MSGRRKVKDLPHIRRHSRFIGTGERLANQNQERTRFLAGQPAWGGGCERFGMRVVSPRLRNRVWQQQKCRDVSIAALQYLKDCASYPALLFIPTR
jgi:hypothetical protein